MVVGNGLIAKRFKSYSDDDDFLIFASGVSNSKSTNQSEYEREFDLLKQNIEKRNSKTLVYFSTCSINDQAENRSAYITHKKNVENYIQSNVGRYVIYRVSNLVGKSSNFNTILNFIVYHIQHGINFDLWLKATRNLIDVDDFYTIAHHILQNKLFSNKILNIANPQNYPVKEIVEAIEMHLNKKANAIPVHKGGDMQIDISETKPLFEELNIGFDDNYLKKLLNKYYSV